MFDLVEIELTRVRKMAEHADDPLLTYLIDMAIIQANAKTRAPAICLEALLSQEPRTLQRDRRRQNFPRKTTVPRPHVLTTPQPS